MPATPLSSRHWPVRLLGGLAILAAATGAAGEAFPARPIRIVTSEPGSGTDLVARLVAQGLTDRLGRQVIVENRGGMLSGDVVMKAAPDGYTLLVSGTSLWLAPFLRESAHYNPVRDFTPVTLAASSPSVLVVHPSVPVESVQELVALAKAKPGQLTIGSSGTATPAHIAGELFRVAAAIDLLPVFYKGAAGPVIEVIGGQITLAIETISPILPHVSTGKLKALGVTSTRRATQLPDVPTIAESGYPGFEVVNWYGVLAPAGTPRNVIARLAGDITRTVKSPDIRARLIGAGVEVVDSTPAEYAAFRKSDLAKWATIIKQTNLRMD